MDRWNQTEDNYALPFSEWPEADQRAWQRALVPATFLEEANVASGWSEGGRTMAVDGYAHWLGWLDRSGLLDRHAPAASRVTRERVKTYAEVMATRGLAPMTVQSRIRQLGRAMRAMAPDQDWSWLSRAADRIRAEAVPVRQKRPRMQEVQALAELGVSMMERAEASDAHFATQRAVLYRDGLMIALLAHRPLRMRSFAALTLGRQLVQREAEWWLVMGADDTKTGRPMEMPFPEALVGHLQCYLDEHRPALQVGRSKLGETRPATEALWLGKGGRMLGKSAISLQIRRHTEEAFGQSVNPHLFRDCAATSIAIQDPEHVRMILPILGHATLATSERHYNQAGTLEASRRLQKAVREQRLASKEWGI
jgi:integrase/recombinase XerD